VECREPVFSCDLFPTVLRAVGLSDKARPPGDGVDMTPVLRNPKATLPREALFFHYPHYYATTSPVSAIRKGQWKLLEYFEDGRTELYDLSQDLGEERDLSLAEPELAKALVEELRAWRKDVKAQQPEANPAHPRANTKSP
jgi:arylsulfatase A-like enzyme